MPLFVSGLVRLVALVLLGEEDDWSLTSDCPFIPAHFGVVFLTWLGAIIPFATNDGAYRMAHAAPNTNHRNIRR